MRCNGGGGAALTVKHADPTIATALYTIVFPASLYLLVWRLCFSVELVIDVAASDAALVSTIVVLEGVETVVTFLVRIFLVDEITIFGTEDRFLRELFVYMGTLLSLSDSKLAWCEE